MKLTNEVKIALVAIVGIVLLFFGLQYLKGLRMFSTDEHYYARFSDVTGMSASSPIYANGYKVGVVESIDYNYADPENIVATISVDNSCICQKAQEQRYQVTCLATCDWSLSWAPIL